MSQIWRCPECTTTEEISYDWLVEHGTPVCGVCDCNMVLQLEPSRPPTTRHDCKADKLVVMAEQAGLTAENLDELIHDFHADMAANINNDGLLAQINFLVRTCGIRGATANIENLIANRPSEGE